MSVTKALTSLCRILIAVVWLWLAGGVRLSAAQEPEPRKPNVVIIMADDLGYGDISCYGNTTINTPNLDRLAREGVRFTDFHSNGAVCSPTRAALLTGRYQQRAGVSGVITAKSHRHQGLPLEETTLAEALQAEGYTTGMFGKWHLGYDRKYNPVQQGFDEFVGFVSGNIDYHSHVDQEGYYDWWSGDALVNQRGYSTDLIADNANDFIVRNKDKPFFLYIAHEAPHYPFQNRQSKADRAPGGRLNEDFPGTGSEQNVEAIYKDMVEIMDEAIGSTLEVLSTSGLDRHTIVFFCSDNGASRRGSNGNLRGRKGSVWEGGHRVPAIVRWPGKIAPGRESDATITTMDIFPTVLELAGAKMFSDVDGVSIATHLLQEQPVPERVLFWEHVDNRGNHHDAVRDGKWKLVLPAGQKEASLFNLEKDIQESHNIASRNPRRVASMLEKLNAWKTDVDPGDDNAVVSEPPNIVFILADDMGYGDVSENNPYARVHTPEIDALAQRGLRFTEAHSAGSVCTPSRYSLLTGRYFFREPRQRSHWGYLKPYIDSAQTTVASLLQRRGYATACIGKWHLGLNWESVDDNPPATPDAEKPGYTHVDFTKPVSGGPNEVGFDYSFILPASLDMPPYVFVKNNHVVDTDIILTADVYPTRLPDTEYSWDRKHVSEKDIYWQRGVWWRNGEMSRSFRIEECMDVIAQEGLAFIERQAEQQKPFFLYLPLAAPHTPWVPGEEYRGKTTLGAYGDFITHIDAVVGSINEKLKELGIKDNTMIVFSSDNGAAWQREDIMRYAHHSSWGRRGMKGDAWDGGHHVPLIINWPRVVKPGGVYSHDVSLVDFFATAADLTQQPLDEDEAADSFSFAEVLKGNTTEPVRDHIIYLASSGRMSIKKGDWKYIEGLGSAGFSQPSRIRPAENGPTDQLYNMKDDVLEINNLFLKRPEVVKDLKARLEQIVRDGYSRKK